MKRLLIMLSVVIAVVAPAVAGVKGRYKHDPSFAVPPAFWNDPDCVPANYLESFPIKKVDARLNEQQRAALRKLFVSAYDASKAKLKQDYPIATSTPIYRLLKTNCPVVVKYEGEGGAIVFPGEIKKALEAKPSTRER